MDPLVGGFFFFNQYTVGPLYSGISHLWIWRANSIHCTIPFCIRDLTTVFDAGYIITHDAA